MPDAPIKNTFFFVTKGAPVDCGWTETWWSFHNTLDLAKTAAKQYAIARSELLGYGARMLAWRGALNPAAFGLPAPKRVSSVYFFTLQEGTSAVYKAPGVGDDFDPAHEDLLCRVEAAQLPGPPVIKPRRSAFMSGLPDSVTDQLKTQGVDQVFLTQAAFKQWVMQLVNIPYYVRIKTAAGPPPVYTAYGIQTVSPIMVRHRNRGRPFFQFRGRRLA